MQSEIAAIDLLGTLSLVSTLCQMCTATIAAAIGIITFRYTKRQSALTLINHNNALANAVNSAIVTSSDARAVFGRLQAPIVGSPDDAMLFMYLNYVHNTFRMRQIGAVGERVWQDTLSSCAAMLDGLTREQVGRLLARGYEKRFQDAVLARFDAMSATATVVPLPRKLPEPRLAA